MLGWRVVGFTSGLAPTCEVAECLGGFVEAFDVVVCEERHEVVEEFFGGDLAAVGWVGKVDVGMGTLAAVAGVASAAVLGGEFETELLRGCCGAEPRRDDLIVAWSREVDVPDDVIQRLGGGVDALYHGRSGGSATR